MLFGLERFPSWRGTLSGVLLIALVIGYFWPLVIALVNAKTSAFDGGVGEALAHSVGFGLALSGFTTVLGMLLSIAMRKAIHPSHRLLTVLLFPAFLGDAIFAYVSRVLFPLEIILSERGGGSLWWLLILQVVQHLPLVVCLYLIVFERISQHKLDFIRASTMTITEEVRFLLLPEAAAITAVLSVYLFFAGCNSFDLPTILLRASEGTGLEFLNHALNRFYTISPMPAKVVNVMLRGAAATCVLLVTGLIWLRTWPRLHCWIVCNLSEIIGRITPSRSSVVTRWLCTPLLVGSATLLPITGLTVGGVAHHSAARTLAFSELNTVTILRSLLATICAATIIVTILLLVSVWIRLYPGFRLRFRNLALDAGSMIAIFIGLSVPSMCVALVAIYWRLTLFGSAGGLFSLLPWGMAHFVAVMPLLLFFLYIASFAVKDCAIDFACVSRMSMRETIYLVFCDKNIRMYQLTYLLGITIIWNNTAVNTLFGPYVYPASVALHNTLTSGRGVMGAATLLMLPTLVLAVLCCLVFYKMSARKGV